MNVILNYLSRTGNNIGRRRSHGYRKWNLKMPSTIIVVNIDSHNRFKNSRPCDHCLCILRYYGIKYVIYSTGSGDPLKAFCKEQISTMEFMGTSSGNRRNGNNSHIF
jgi:hypothetical protein